LVKKSLHAALSAQFFRRAPNDFIAQGFMDI